MRAKRSASVILAALLLTLPWLAGSAEAAKGGKKRTPTPTRTVAPQPTATLTPTAALPTVTPTLPPPSATATRTATPLSPSATPTRTPTPLSPTATPTRTATPLPPTATPTHTAALAPTPTRTPTLAPPTATPTSTPSAACSIFPADNPWNADISGYPLHPNSASYVNFIGSTKTLHPDFGTFWQGAPIGIPWALVPGDQPLLPVDFLYDADSDPGPYPIPENPPIEGGPASDGDRHILMLGLDRCELHELYWAWPPGQGPNPSTSRWFAGSGAIFDLRSNALRPDGWTSADAAGLPIFPGLVRYDEVVEDGEIRHALRFTVRATQQGFIHPATHYASSSTDPSLPPMGLRLRMKASYSCASYSAEVQVICAALKRYGMFVADNGSDWFVTGEHDPRWNDDALGDLKLVPGSAFEAVYTGDILRTPPP